MYKKDNDPIQSYAYPCTATGTLFLVFGLIICSHVVESSTVEKTYRPKGMEARMVWLQKQGVVITAPINHKVKISILLLYEKGKKKV